MSRASGAPPIAAVAPAINPVCVVVSPGPEGRLLGRVLGPRTQGHIDRPGAFGREHLQRYSVAWPVVLGHVRDEVVHPLKARAVDAGNDSSTDRVGDPIYLTGPGATRDTGQWAGPSPTVSITSTPRVSSGSPLAVAMSPVRDAPLMPR